MLTGQGRCTKNGFGMVDTVMALCMVMLGVLALLAILPIGWSSAGNTDRRGRAGEILQSELENTQALIMNPCNSMVIATFPAKVVYATGNAAVTANAGDLSFTVNKTIANDPLYANVWRITATVKWPGTTTGVTASRVVMRQEDYRYSNSSNPPNACADNSVTTISWN